MEPLAIGLALVIGVAIIIVCSVIISGLSQRSLLQTARQNFENKAVNLNEAETELIKEMRRNWLREEILPLSFNQYNALLLPDHKLIITLNRPVAEPAPRRTGWLVLELTEAEVIQPPNQTLALIQRFLQNARLVTQERAARN